MGQYKWEQKIFTPEDFDGSGQYIIREPKNKEQIGFIQDTGYLSTLIKKVAYFMDKGNPNGLNAHYALVDMSDGLIHTGYFTGTKNEKGESTPTETWVWHSFAGEDNYNARLALCEYLNNNPYGTTFRFATNEELIRVAAYQKWRTS